jgi:hypothetical protein
VICGDWQSSAMPRRLGSQHAALALGALVVVSTLVRFALSRGVDAPWIAPDEHLYGLVGRSLVHGDGLTIVDGRVPYYSFLYPLFVGAATVVADVAMALTLTQLGQALVMSATAIPVYFWARPLAGPRLALFASTLTVLIPGLAYSALLMSEALYFPVAVLAAWALAACLRSPSLLNQAVLVAAIGVALATRLQAIGFVAAVVVALGALALGERSIAPFRRLLPTLVAFGAVGGIWLAARLASGGTGDALGAYATLAEAEEYTLSDVASSVAWQAGAVVILTVGVPLIALGVLAWELLRGRESDAGVRALVATALAYLVVTVVEVGVFASRFVEHITERQLLSVAPPVFVAFAVWLRRGMPRPQPATSVIAIAVAASALLLPVDRITTRAAAADALSTVPLEYLRRQVSEVTFESLYAGAAAAFLLFAVLAPRRAAPVVAGVVAVALAAGSLVASHEMRTRSQFDRNTIFADAPVSWLDDLGANDVAFLVTRDRIWPSVWHHMFWNRSITSVVRVRDTRSPGVVPQEVVSIRDDGVLVNADGEPVEAAQLVTPTSVRSVGEQLTTIAPNTEAGFTLWNVEPPLRIQQRITGLQPNGDLYGGGKAVVEVFGCGPGELQLTLLGKQGLSTRIKLNGRVVAERAIPTGGVWRPAVREPEGANGSVPCVYVLESDGLIGSTRIEFVRTG